MKKIFSFFKKNKNKDVENFIDAYSVIFSKVTDAVDDYEAKISEKEIIKMHYVDVQFTTGLKITMTDLREVAFQIDESILSKIENDGDIITSFANCLPKHTTIPFCDDMLLNKSIEIITLPMLEKEDIGVYSGELFDAYNGINNYEHKITGIKTSIKNLENKGVNDFYFKKLLAHNESELLNLKRIFAEELVSTKIDLDKTLNFISLPIDINMDTVFVHTYFRKLIDKKLLSHTKQFRRFTTNRPKIVAKYFKEMGLFYLNQKEKVESVETTETA